jgi:hypothetical protein
MSEAMKLIVTGIGVFALSQIIQRLFVEPIQEFNKTRGRIAAALLRHDKVGRRWMNEHGELPPEPEKLRQGIGNELLSLAGDLSGSAAIIPMYPLIALVFRLPKRRQVYLAMRAMDSWASSLANSDFIEPDHYIDIVDKELKLNVMIAFDHTGWSKPKWDKFRRAYSRSRKKVNVLLERLQELSQSRESRN